VRGDDILFPVIPCLTRNLGSGFPFSPACAGGRQAGMTEENGNDRNRRFGRKNWKFL